MIAVFYAMKSEIGKEPFEWFSLEEEIRLPEWQKPEREKFWGVVKKGRYQGREIVLAQTGIWRTGLFGCKGNTQAKKVVEFVVERYSPEKIIFVGTSGGMQEDLKTSDLIICDPIYAQLRCPVWPHPTKIKPPIHPDPQLLSLARETLEKRDVRFFIGGDLQTSGYGWPRKKYPEIQIVEMEDYFVASVARVKGIPFLAVRVVMEPYGEDLTNPDPGYQTFKKDRYSTITTILRDQFLLPFLQRL